MAGRAAAQDAEAEADAPTPPEDETVLPAPKLPDPEGARALPPPDRVWYDPDQHLVYVDGYVSLREGYPGDVCVPGGHEGARVGRGGEHAGRDRPRGAAGVGAVEGHPVQYKPRFAPPEGTEIEIEVRWLDPQGEWQSARAQEWVRDVETKKPMELPWVFAGQRILDRRIDRQVVLHGRGGDFICVSNFTTATLDVPIESSQSNEGLLFEANTDRIPELGTPVRLVLKPVLEEEEEGESK